MKIVDKDRFDFLKKKKLIQCSNCFHLDDLRIGLRVKNNIIQAPREITNLKKPENHNWQRINLKKDKLIRQEFYLGLSQEKIKLPNFIFGLIHSRSIFARVGLDVVQSSFFVTPGFGGHKPLPFVLELFPKITIKIDFTIPVAGLLLFETEKEHIGANQKLADLFPLKYKF